MTPVVNAMTIFAALVREIADPGHEIGSHGFHHQRG